MSWFMIFAGGLLGSSHCVGMCGGFALALGSGVSSFRANIGRQLIYSLGRVFTYCVCGAAAGYVGIRLTNAFRPLADIQALLSIGAGAILIVLGLSAAGVFRALGITFARAFAGSAAVSAPVSCLASTFFAAFLTRPRLLNIFLAGLLNGLLPCGLVYAFLALAASSGDLLTAATTMGLFGLGTVPAMILVGCGGQLLSLAARRHIFCMAAWCVVLTGVLTVVRGFGFAHLPGMFDMPGCALCR
jgi:uncharacterized protein